LNADAVFTSLPITVGGNVHLIDGKQMFTNKQTANYIAVFEHSFGKPKM